MIVYGETTVKRVEDTSYEIEIVGVPVAHFPYIFGVFVLGAYIGPLLMLLSFVLFVFISRTVNKQRRDGNIVMSNEHVQTISRQLRAFMGEGFIEIENEVLDE